MEEDAGLEVLLGTPNELNLWTNLYPIEKEKIIELITRVFNDKSFLDVISPIEESIEDVYLSKLYLLGKDIMQFNNDDRLLCKAVMSLMDQMIEIVLSKEIENYRYVHVVDIEKNNVYLKIYF